MSVMINNYLLIWGMELTKITLGSETEKHLVNFCH